MKYAVVLLMFICGLAVKACDKGETSGTKSVQSESSEKAEEGRTQTQTARLSAKTTAKTAKTAPKPKDTKASASKVDTKAASAKPVEAKKPAGKCDGPVRADCSKNTKDDSWTLYLIGGREGSRLPLCSRSVDLPQNGKLDECKLVKDAQIGAYTCRAAPNSVKLHPSGKLAACSLAEGVEIGGFTYKRYAGIRLFEDGSPQTAFLKDGSKEIAGFQCTKAIRLFEGGKLQTCTLTADAKVGKQTIPSGYQLILNKDGSIRGLRNWSGKVKYAEELRKGKAGALYASRMESRIRHLVPVAIFNLGAVVKRWLELT